MDDIVQARNNMLLVKKKKKSKIPNPKSEKLLFNILFLKEMIFKIILIKKEKMV